VLTITISHASIKSGTRISAQVSIFAFLFAEDAVSHLTQGSASIIS
jgi:hypothetical protein